MLAWLQHGPLSVSIDATFGGYTGGVLSGAGCNHSRVDHAVLPLTPTPNPTHDPNPNQVTTAASTTPCC